MVSNCYSILSLFDELKHFFFFVFLFFRSCIFNVCWRLNTKGVWWRPERQKRFEDPVKISSFSVTALDDFKKENCFSFKFHWGTRHNDSANEQRTSPEHFPGPDSNLTILKRDSFVKLSWKDDRPFLWVSIHVHLQVPRLSIPVIVRELIQL